MNLAAADLAGPSLADHRLAKHLAPRSIALVGASPKPDSVGNGMIRGLRGGGFTGRVYAINPNYQEIDGIPCFPSLAELPERVDHALLGVANVRLEAAMADAVAAGTPAATILASGYLEGDGTPPLTKRIAALARGAGMAVCGGNGMGFYNNEAHVRLCGFPPPDWITSGPIALISHSGSAFSALVHNDRRFGYCLAVSAGQELVTNAADYLDYALRMPSTRVVGLFLEAIRDPAGFLAGLELANQRDIPVIAIKVGRTPESAKLALSHSGALVGDEAVHRAVFRRHGVIEVEDLDEFANALLLFSQPRRLARGGLATMHDSGGERELLVDLAAAKRVPFAEIAASTREKLASRLDYGLEPINPLDAWGTGHDYQGIFGDCMSALLADPDTAIGALCVETRTGKALHEGYAEAMRQAHAGSEKPVIFINNLAAPGDDDLAVAITRTGLPVLIGLKPALAAIRGAMDRRDFRLCPAMAPAAAPKDLGARWRKRLATGGALEEAEGLRLFADYRLPVLPHRIVEDGPSLLIAGRELGFPLVLKTAMPGILHKSDVGGVKLGLADAPALAAAYDDMAPRLGPRVLVTPMAPLGTGLELAFGAKIDPSFGPVVMVGAGGVLIEFLKDQAVSLAPFDAAEAQRLIDSLALRPLLDGKRGRPPADLPLLAEALAAFSVMAADLADAISEIDANPVLATADGPLALDALVLARK
ncbi:MAG TPA: acetate--CoA ligase family protein [Dongiaceae bacterium]|nr:acetate--CoA ligase family protein [Dongiaceae bacterium]